MTRTATNQSVGSALEAEGRQDSRGGSDGLRDAVQLEDGMGARGEVGTLGARTLTLVFWLWVGRGALARDPTPGSGHFYVGACYWRARAGRGVRRSPGGLPHFGCR